MTPGQMIHFFHGNAVYIEFPEHEQWFIPKLVNDLNRFLKGVDGHTCSLTLKNYLGKIVEFEISDDQVQHIITIRYDDFLFKLDPFLVEFVKKINTYLIHRFNGYGIVPLRPVVPANEEYVKSNLFLAFASRTAVLNGIPEYSILGDKSDYIPLIPEEAGNILHIPMQVPFNQLHLKHASDYYEGNHHLPVYLEMDFSGYLHDEIALILNLNPNNKINVHVGPVVDTVTEKVEVVYRIDDLQATGLVDRWAFIYLGKQFNQLLKGNDQQYCLLEPDGDNYIYVYCDYSEFELLKENEYIHKDYVNIFE